MRPRGPYSVEALEPRIFLSADPALGLTATPDTPASQLGLQAEYLFETSEPWAGGSEGADSTSLFSEQSLLFGGLETTSLELAVEADDILSQIPADQVLALSGAGAEIPSDLPQTVQETLVEEEGGNSLAALTPLEVRTEVHLSLEQPLEATDGLVLGERSELSGNGTVLGSVVTNGVVSAGNSPGILDVVGNFDLGPAATLLVEIGGLTPGPGNPVTDQGFDQVRVTGDVSLSGLLDIDLLNNFAPEAGQSYTILTYQGTLTGSFSDATGLYGFGSQGLYFDIVHDPSTKALKLVVKEAPGGSSVLFDFANEEQADDFGKILGSYFSSFTAFNPINVSVSISSFASLSGNFAISRGLDLNVRLSDGQTTSVSFLSIGGSDIRAFFGLGPYFVDSNQDGAITSADTPNADAVGAVIEHLNFGMGMFFSLAKQTGYFALKAEIDRAAFVGLEDVTIEAGGVRLEINQARGAFETPLNPAPVIDFAASGGVSIPTGGTPVSAHEKGPACAHGKRAI